MAEESKKMKGPPGGVQPGGRMGADDPVRQAPSPPPEDPETDVADTVDAGSVAAQSPEDPVERAQKALEGIFSPVLGMKPVLVEDRRYIARTVLEASGLLSSPAKPEGLRDGLDELVERAVYPIAAALNCPAHPWHGADEARRWLMDAAKLRSSSPDPEGEQ